MTLDGITRESRYRRWGWYLPSCCYLTSTCKIYIYNNCPHQQILHINLHNYHNFLIFFSIPAPNLLFLLSQDITPYSLFEWSLVFSQYSVGNKKRENWPMPLWTADTRLRVRSCRPIISSILMCNWRTTSWIWTTEKKNGWLIIKLCKCKCFMMPFLSMIICIFDCKNFQNSTLIFSSPSPPPNPTWSDMYHPKILFMQPHGQTRPDLTWLWPRKIWRSSLCSQVSYSSSFLSASGFWAMYLCVDWSYTWQTHKPFSKNYPKSTEMYIWPGI